MHCRFSVNHFTGVNWNSIPFFSILFTSCYSIYSILYCFLSATLSTATETLFHSVPFCYHWRLSTDFVEWPFVIVVMWLDPNKHTHTSYSIQFVLLTTLQTLIELLFCFILLYFIQWHLRNHSTPIHICSTMLITVAKYGYMPIRSQSDAREPDQAKRGQSLGLAYVKVQYTAFCIEQEFVYSAFLQTIVFYIAQRAVTRLDQTQQCYRIRSLILAIRLALTKDINILALT